MAEDNKYNYNVLSGKDRLKAAFIISSMGTFFSWASAYALDTASTIGGSLILGLCYVGAYLKYIDNKENNLKLVHENKYQQMLIEEKDKTLEEQKGKLMLGIATLSYVSTDNYPEFENSYKESMKEILGNGYEDNLVDALTRYRVYLTSHNKEEFRTNLEKELNTAKEQKCNETKKR